VSENIHINLKLYLLNSKQGTAEYAWFEIFYVKIFDEGKTLYVNEIDNLNQRHTKRKKWTDQREINCSCSKID